MDFYIAADVAKRIPTIFVGAVVARHADNRRGAAEAAALLSQAQEAVAAEIGAERGGGSTWESWPAGSSWESRPPIALWRRAFEQAGLDPRYPSSIEALLRRIASGERIPSINPAVDIANALSLKYRLPVGAHDVDQLHGDLGIKLAGEGIHFLPPQAEEDEIVPTGELVYGDTKEVRTRRWVWRQSARGRVTPSSTTIFFPIDGFKGETDEAVRDAVAELEGLVRELLAARTRRFFVDAHHPSQPILRFGMISKVKPGGDAIDEAMGRGVVDLITREELEPRLRGGEKLKVKLGFDPTGPLLHVGRATQLFKLRQFQRLGHTIQFVVGNFTGMLGDASDKTAKRQMLTAEQVQANMAKYVEQVGKILDTSTAEIYYNADWLSELRMADVIRLASEFTVAQMIERENFIERYRTGKPIGLHEFLYPLLQGQDSVELHSDVEVGGTDQLFNLLAGRVLQRAAGQRPQAVITGPLIPGTNGEKMSTSLGNTVNILDSPRDQYFAIMRMVDELMITYYETCTTVPLDEIRALSEELEDDRVNPMEVKRRLARTIVGQFHSPEAALQAEEEWDEQVRHGGVPDDVPVIELPSEPRPLVDLLVACNLAASKSEARRLIEQRAVAVDGERVAAANESITPRDGMLVRSGKKRWARIAVAT